MNALLDYDAEKYLCLGKVLGASSERQQRQALWILPAMDYRNILRGLAELKGRLRLPARNRRLRRSKTTLASFAPRTPFE